MFNLTIKTPERRHSTPFSSVSIVDFKQVNVSWGISSSDVTLKSFVTSFKQIRSVFISNFNPFLANVPMSYPLKTPGIQMFSGAFRGYKMGTLTRNGLKRFLSAG